MSGFGTSLFSKIGFVCLYVSNFQESIKFYRDVLGLEPDTQVSTDNFFAFKTGGTQLALERDGFRKDGQKNKDENPILLQFRAESPEQLEEMNKQLKTRGVYLTKRSQENSWGMSSNFLDPDGNKLSIVWMR